MARYIVLTNSAGCELDRRKIKDPNNIAPSMIKAIEAWVLYPGDTITIKEDEEHEDPRFTLESAGSMKNGIIHQIV